MKRKLDITILKLSSSSHCVIVAAIAGRRLFYAFFFSQWPSGPAIVSPPRPLSPAAACSRTMGKGRKDNLESKRRKTHTPTIRTVGRLVGGYWLPYCTVRSLFPSDWHSGFFFTTDPTPAPTCPPTYLHSVHYTSPHSISCIFHKAPTRLLLLLLLLLCTPVHSDSAQRGGSKPCSPAELSQRLSYNSLNRHPSKISSFLTFDFFSPCHNLQHRRSCLSFSPRFRSSFAHLHLDLTSTTNRPPLKKKDSKFQSWNFRLDRLATGPNTIRQFACLAHTLRSPFVVCVPARDGLELTFESPIRTPRSRHRSASKSQSVKGKVKVKRKVKRRL